MKNTVSTFRAQAFWVVIGDAMTVLALLAASMVLARTLSQEEMATFRQVTYLGPLFVSVLELGLSATVYRYYVFYETTDRQLFLWKVLLGTLIMAITGSIGLFVGAPYIALAFGNTSLEAALRICSGYPLAMMPFMLVRPVLIAKGFSLRATLWEGLFSAGSAATLSIESWRGATLNSGLALWMAVQGTRFAVVVWYMSKELKHSRPTWVPRIFQEVWAYTWPLQLSRVPGLAMSYFDKVVTSVMLSSRNFASYALGARELPLVGDMAFSISSVLTPHMIRAYKEGKTDEMCGYWRDAAMATAIFTYPVAAFCIWHAKAIVTTLFTNVYNDAAIPFAAFAAITFLRVVEFGSMAKAIGDSKIILYGTSVAATSSLLLSATMTYLWGIWGISLSLLISNVIHVAYYLIRYSSLLKRPVNALLPLWRLLILLGWSFASVAAIDNTVSVRLPSISHSTMLEQASSLIVLFSASAATFMAPIVFIYRTHAKTFLKWFAGMRTASYAK